MDILPRLADSAVASAAQKWDRRDSLIGAKARSWGKTVSATQSAPPHFGNNNATTFRIPLPACNILVLPMTAQGLGQRTSMLVLIVRILNRIAAGNPVARRLNFYKLLLEATNQ
jgi:hypothetical protein